MLKSIHLRQALHLTELCRFYRYHIFASTGRSFSLTRQAVPSKWILPYTHFSPRPGTHLSERLLRPRLLAKILAVHLLVGHVNPVRQSGHQREYPYGSDNLRRRPYGHPGLERVDDDEESIDSNRCQRQRGRVHAGALRVRHDVAKYLAKHPMACGQGKNRYVNMT